MPETRRMFSANIIIINAIVETIFKSELSFYNEIKANANKANMCASASIIKNLKYIIAICRSSAS